jgi:2-dehydro-3-deoxy-D-arabinonate dehydratase
LYRCYEFTNGVVFSTGTGIVPPMETFLIENDQVAITVGGIGTLSNTVKTVQKGN